jgi:mono/diheme cytochrome c family protein
MNEGCLQGSATMKKTILCGIAVALVGAVYLQATVANPQSLSPIPAHISQYRELLDRYCVTCHNVDLATADLLLDQADVEKVSANVALWSKVVQKLRAGEMPPVGMPRPDPAAYDSFAAYLEAGLGGSAAADAHPARPFIHRLNRAEYTNAVRDLLAVEFDAQSYLPADGAGEGFDNLASVLSVSPVLMERYMSAAGKISRLALGNASSLQTIETYLVAEGLVQDTRLSDDLPFGSRGGMAIRHHFPVDGEYLIKIRLERDRTSFIRGLLGEPHQLDVFLEGSRIKRFAVGGERHGATGILHTRTGNIYMGEPEQNYYELAGAEEGLEIRFTARAGRRLVGVVFLKKTLEPEGLLEVGPRPMGSDVGEYKGGDPSIGSVTITGPFDAKGVGDMPSRRRIFVCHPATDNLDEESCAREILSTLARRAYRRPVTDADVQALLGLYRAGQSEGGFEAGIELALQRILAGPEFLFRIERKPANLPPDTVYPVSDLELASRLSFFLWSSIPDDQLLGLAEGGQLTDPVVLENQVHRMLADYRSNALVENFAGQWLYLRNLRDWRPSVREFPDFDGELRQALQQETELFFKSMLREDRSLLDLLNADYTFLNERLARHYGIPDVYGSNFRRVTLKDDNRRGLLGQGSILMVTSRPNRTSPVLRGKWVLGSLLGMPPSPPPPDVPALNEAREEVGDLTMRQRMEQHRVNPACTSCHVQMDAMGFALENFDAIGKWRTTEGKAPIDASGVLVDGTRFEGPAGLRQVLLSRPEQFVQNVTEKLLTYALGRDLDSHDDPAVQQILREGAPGGYRWSSLILGIIKSTPFQMRRSQP